MQQCRSAGRTAKQHLQSTNTCLSQGEYTLLLLVAGVVSRRLSASSGSSVASAATGTTAYLQNRMSASAVKRVRGVLGKSVEDDVIEWVASALEDGGYEAVADFAEGIAGMLEASGIISDEDAALPIAERLWKSTTEAETTPKTIKAPVQSSGKGTGGLRKPALRTPRVPKSADKDKVKVEPNPMPSKPDKKIQPATGMVDLTGLASKLAARGVGQKQAAPQRGPDGKMLSAPVSLASAADELAGARGAVIGSLMSGGSTDYKSQNKLIEWSEADKEKAKKVSWSYARVSFPTQTVLLLFADSRAYEAESSSKEPQSWFRC